MVAEGHRLGGLQVGEAGHDGGRFTLGQVQQSGHQVQILFFQNQHLVTQPQADIGGHLVVPGTAGVQFLAGDADLVGEPRFNVHVHVFQGNGPLEFAGFDLFLDFRQAIDDGVALFLGEHAYLRQHGGVGLGAEDVLTVHASVKIHAGGEFLHELVGGFAEAAAPEFVLLLVGHRTVPMHKAGFARRAV